MQLSTVDGELQVHENYVDIEKWEYPCRSAIFKLFNFMAHIN